MSEDPPPDAQGRSLVVIGASAGGVDALCRVVAHLPVDLAAAVCVVLHISPDSPSALAQILQRCGPLPCRTAADGDPLREGQILVAAPDHHLAIRDRHVALTLGPRENGHRPSVDVLFRSAAAAQGSRVIGVVLSGSRDDGSAGLAMIKHRGGAVVVQDPAEALYGAMPENAIAAVTPDAVARCDGLAAEIVKLVDDSPSGDRAFAVSNVLEPTSPVMTVCPECGGVLSEDSAAGLPQWVCRVGHRYSMESLADAQAGDVEAALWAAVRALEDRRDLLARMACDAEARGRQQTTASLRERAGQADRQVTTIREALGAAARTTLRSLAEGEPTH